MKRLAGRPCSNRQASESRVTHAGAKAHRHCAATYVKDRRYSPTTPPRSATTLVPRGGKTLLRALETGEMPTAGLDRRGIAYVALTLRLVR